MKKLSLAVLVSVMLAACTADMYSDKGNATIIASKNLPDNNLELVVQRDNGETVTLTHEYDAHAAVGARVQLADGNNNPELKTIRRYEFK